jgi:predicted TIM-barrel fold metal-dependent hydrolase
MHGHWFSFVIAIATAIAAGPGCQAPGRPAPFNASAPGAQADGPEAWRREKRLVDMHVHIDARPDRFARAAAIMDRVGIGLSVNLSGGTTTHSPGAPSAFEVTKRIADERFPGRFLQYMNLDYARWDDADFPEQAVRHVEEGYRLGAAGLKEFKRLGLWLKDGSGKLLAVDDPRLDPMWRRLGELGMPVSIHVADPRAFWQPYDSHNERWEELGSHPDWWFGDPTKYPAREALLEALDRVIARHPETTFVCVHVGNNAEDLAWVGAALDRHPNMMADVAARIPELGRQDPAAVRAFFVKHQDRILFATDLQVHDRLTLGSGGDGESPTDADAADFFQKHWRFFETNDVGFPHMTPIQGRWTISGVGLPAPVLRKIYFENARRLLARSLPKQ